MAARHWSSQFVGLPYSHDDMDCAALCERVQREIYGRTLRLPRERATGYRGQSRQILAHRDAVATITETPREGDGVLMIGRGHINHIGIYCMIGTEAWVLHAMKSAGHVVLHRLRSLPAVGLTVEGFYRWN